MCLEIKIKICSAAKHAYNPSANGRNSSCDCLPATLVKSVSSNLGEDSMVEIMEINSMHQFLSSTHGHSFTSVRA